MHTAARNQLLGFCNAIFEPRPRELKCLCPIDLQQKMQKQPCRCRLLAELPVDVILDAFVFLVCYATSFTGLLGIVGFAYQRADHTQWRWSDAGQVEHWGFVAVPKVAGPGSKEDLNSGHGHVTSGILNQDIFCPIAIETQDLGSHSI